MNTTLRAFIAVELSASARAAAAAIVGGLRERTGLESVRWTDPERYHVTLRFIGVMGRDLVPALGEALEERLAGVDPFGAALNGVDGFPSRERARVVVV
ncbi:MAG: 2'-5' RNA ligase family protein [Verrucomicrobiales bacterium]